MVLAMNPAENLVDTAGVPVITPQMLKLSRGERSPLGTWQTGQVYASPLSGVVLGALVSCCVICILLGASLTPQVYQRRPHKLSNWSVSDAPC